MNWGLGLPKWKYSYDGRENSTIKRKRTESDNLSHVIAEDALDEGKAFGVIVTMVKWTLTYLDKSDINVYAWSARNE